MKHIICGTIPTDIERLGDAIQKDGLLHFITEDSVTTKDSVYEAVWDGRSKSLTVLKGDPATLTMRYLGWPEK